MNTTQPSAKIQLNIGGTIFTTTLGTLTSEKDSFFAGLFDEEIGYDIDTNTEHFIDRHPAYFHIILNHLRGYNVKKLISELTPGEQQILEDDVDFYNIASMVDMFPHLYARQNQFKQVILSNNERVIQTWDMNTRTCVSTTITKFSVKCMLQLAENQVLCGQFDGGINVYDLLTHKIIKTWAGHKDKIMSMVRIDKDRFATGGKDSSIKVWNMDTDCLKTMSEHTDVVRSLLVQNEKNLISAADDSKIKIWNIESGECLDTLETHESYVISLLKWDENMFLSGSADKTIKIWRFKERKEVATLEGHGGGIWVLEKLDQERFLSACSAAAIKVWKLSTKECLFTINSAHANVIQTVLVLSPTAIISCSMDETVKLWNLDSKEGTELKTHGSVCCAIFKEVDQN